MKKTSTLLLLLAFVATTWGQVPGKNVQNNSSIDLFWQKFRAAVTKEDKVTLAGLSQFPIGMPYGVPLSGPALNSPSAIVTSLMVRRMPRTVFEKRARRSTRTIPESLPSPAGMPLETR